MTEQCPKTCGRCTGTVTVPTTTCVDKLNPSTGVSDCPSRSNLCSNAAYYNLMTEQCPKTCGRCGNNGGGGYAKWEVLGTDFGRVCIQGGTVGKTTEEDGRVLELEFQQRIPNPFDLLVLRCSTGGITMAEYEWRTQRSKMGWNKEKEMDKIVDCPWKQVPFLFAFPKRFNQDSMHIGGQSAQCCTIAFEMGRMFLRSETPMPMLKLCNNRDFFIETATNPAPQISTLPPQWQSLVIDSIVKGNRGGRPHITVPDCFMERGLGFASLNPPYEDAMRNFFKLVNHGLLKKLKQRDGFIILGIVGRAIILMVSPVNNTVVFADSHGRNSMSGGPLLAFSPINRLKNLIELVQLEGFPDAPGTAQMNIFVREDEVGQGESVNRHKERRTNEKGEEEVVADTEQGKGGVKREGKEGKEKRENEEKAEKKEKEEQKGGDKKKGTEGETGKEKKARTTRRK